MGFEGTWKAHVQQVAGTYRPDRRMREAIHIAEFVISNLALRLCSRSAQGPCRVVKAK